MQEDKIEFGTVEMIKMDLIDDDPHQPRRKEFLEAPLKELAESIRRHGVREPIHVIPKDGRYSLLNGGRRCMANRMAGNDEIPALVLASGNKDLDRLLTQLLSNSHREDLNPLELCDTYLSLMRAKKINAAELCALVSKSKTYVSNVLSLNSLPDNAKQAIRAGKIGLAKGALLARMHHAAINNAIKEAEAGTLTRADLESQSSKASSTGKPQRAAKRVNLVTELGSVCISANRRLTVDDLINMLIELTRACRKASKEGLDLSTLASLLRDRSSVREKEVL